MFTGHCRVVKESCAEALEDVHRQYFWQGWSLLVTCMLYDCLILVAVYGAAPDIDSKLLYPLHN